MRLGRLMLVVATLVTILVFPVLIRDALQALQSPNAYAAAGAMDAAGRVYQNGNTDDNGNTNGNANDNDGGNNGGNNDDDDDDNNNDNDDESDNEGEDNENFDIECYASLNNNEDEVECDPALFPDNDNVYVPPAPAPAAGAGTISASRSCFDVGEIGNVQLSLEGGTITVQVVPPGSLSQATWLELDDVEDLGTVPAPPAGTALLDHMVWRLNAGANCDGPGIGELPGAVNLGIPYHVAADKSELQIVRLDDGEWEEVLTVPDPNPNNPYISSTIRETGTYAVIVRP